MLSADQATGMLLDAVRPTCIEEVLLEEALGRVLGRDLIAGEDVPGYDRAAMDGYAIRSADTAMASSQAPVRLKVVEAVAAGHLAHSRVESGTAVAISTGAAVPAGADSVVRFEETREGPESIEVFRPIPPGENIGPRGEDITKGSVVLRQGAVIGPAEVGVLAALGQTLVPVFVRPRVAILSTGDEVVPVGERPGLGQVRNSTAHVLAATVQRCGGAVRFLGLVPDDLDAIVSTLESAGIENFDAIITTGGASVGRHDHMRTVMERLGATTLFWRVAIKPGMNIVAAMAGGTLVLGLSGNPAAALTTFEVVLRPVFMAMAGRGSKGLARIPVVLNEDVKQTGGRTRFVRARVYRGRGDDQAGGIVFRASPVGSQLPSVLSSMSAANALLAIPPGGGSIAAGQVVEALILDGMEASIFEHADAC